MHKPPLNRKGTLIRFDTEKLKTFREVLNYLMNRNINLQLQKKMDKGSLRMRTQAHSQHKKKHLTLHQQTFLAVKENRVPEVFIID